MKTEILVEKMKIASFSPSPVKIPELQYMGSKTVEVEELDEMIRDAHNLNEALLYIRHSMDKAIKMDKKVPHKASPEVLREALQDMAEAWLLYEQEPKTTGQTALDKFQARYESEKSFEEEYRTKLKSIIANLGEGEDRLQLEKELNAKYKYQHKACITKFENLFKNEETVRNNCVDHVLKRIAQRLDMAAKLNQKRVPSIVDEAEMTIDIISEVSPTAESIITLSERAQELRLLYSD